MSDTREVTIEAWIAKNSLSIFKDIIVKKYEDDIPLFDTDARRYLVNYQKSRMLDCSGIQTEEYCISDDCIFNFFMEQYGKKYKKDITQQAIKELRNARPQPECKIWFGLGENIPKQFLKQIEIEILPDIEKHVYIASKDDIMIAYAVVGYNHVYSSENSWLKQESSLEHIWVKEQYRKQGYGQLLIKSIQNRPLKIRLPVNSRYLNYFNKYAKRTFIEYAIE